MQKIKIIGKEKADWSLNKDRENIINFFSKIKNVKITNSIFSGIYFFVWYDLAIKNKFYFIFIFFKKTLSIKTVAVITNDITQTPKKIIRGKKLFDLWVSPNSKISSFLRKNNINYIQIPFYVSPKEFYNLNINRNKIAKKLNIEPLLINNKIIIGSFQRDSEGKDLYRPKWQKNPDLLIDICRKLDPSKYVLLLAGPRRHYIVSQCDKYNIPYIYVGNKSYIVEKKDDLFVNNHNVKIMNLLYNLTDLYIVSSLSEGGPKAILEALLTNTLIYSTNVGLAGDILLKNLLYSELDFSNVINTINNWDKEVENIEKNITICNFKVKKMMNFSLNLESYRKVISILNK